MKKNTIYFIALILINIKPVLGLDNFKYKVASNFKIVNTTTRPIYIISQKVLYNMPSGKTSNLIIFNLKKDKKISLGPSITDFNKPIVEEEGFVAISANNKTFYTGFNNVLIEYDLNFNILNKVTISEFGFNDNKYFFQVGKSIDYYNNNLFFLVNQCLYKNGEFEIFQNFIKWNIAQNPSESLKLKCKGVIDGFIVDSKNHIYTYSLTGNNLIYNFEKNEIKYPSFDLSYQFIDYKEGAGFLFSNLIVSESSEIYFNVKDKEKPTKILSGGFNAVFSGNGNMCFLDKKGDLWEGSFDNKYKKILFKLSDYYSLDKDFYFKPLKYNNDRTVIAYNFFNPPNNQILVLDIKEQEAIFIDNANMLTNEFAMLALESNNNGETFEPSR